MWQIDGEKDCVLTWGGLIGEVNGKPLVKMAKRYNFIIIDAANESGIVKDFEVANGAGRYLLDGLYLNTDGQIKEANLYSRVVLNAFNY